MRGLAALALAIAVPGAASAQAPAPLDGNAEMAAIFAADQEDRQGGVTDWEEVAAADARRRARTRELLDRGALTTGPDFYAAAFVFQHGGEPQDYLLAHTLAVRSLGLGFERAEWIAAATLDRFLQEIDREQIYGTQYRIPAGQLASRGRFDPDLLTDQLRVGAGVEPLAEQEARLAEYERRRRERLPDAAGD